MINDRKISNEIFESLKKVISGGVNSPIRAFKDLSMSPLIVSRAQGDTLWDADGRDYIDYCMSFGALILGHAPKAVLNAVYEQMHLGTTYGSSTKIEEQIASLIVSTIPSIDQLRFVSSGTEAVMSALRLARGYTGRSVFIKFDGNYHGHADPFLVKAGSGVSHYCLKSTSKGVPNEVIQHTISLPYNDLEKAREVLCSNKVAAVIVEPVAANMGLIPARADFLSMLREETYKQDALLVFDEVITGFRLGPMGAQGLYHIEPDLTCLGKIIGGGFPAAAFGGKREIMRHLAPEGEVFQAGTLSGNPIAMRAGFETLKLLLQQDVYQKLESLTKSLISPIQEAIQKSSYPMSISHLGSCFSFFFGSSNPQNRNDLDHLDSARFNHFYQTLFSHGIYYPPSPFETAFVSLSHTQKHLDFTRDLIVSYIQNHLD
jgi:glutamate-1-semialdehyde 2,1-aminomutase